MDKIIDKKASDLIDSFVDALKIENFNIKYVYLFGSYANNKNHEDSDIDVAVILGNTSENIFDKQMKMMRIASRLDDVRIEPHPVYLEDFETGTPFVNEIKKTGILIDIH
jgi:predicted nucleotidyltransferase